jgi:hypothetical protein
MPEAGYYLDLSAFSIEKLKNLLKSTRLLPSQELLRDDIDERFAYLEQNGIQNLQQLQSALKTKSDVQSFAEATGLPVDYLTLLRREVNSYQPKPIKLADFPGVNAEVVGKLDQIGIKNTKQLFPHVLTRKDRSEFAKRNLFDTKDVLELTRLTDLARLKWVGPKFARLLIESGYDTVEKVANSDYEELYAALMRMNEERGIYKGRFGKEEFKLWVNVAVQDVPQVVQY